jgi:hypothetical protein
MNIPTAKDLYEMKLFESICPQGHTSMIITRFPGGWVYADLQGSCFIPFHNEFQDVFEAEVPRG